MSREGRLLDLEMSVQDGSLVLVDRALADHSVIGGLKTSHKIIQKRPAFRHEQSVTVRAWRGRWAFSGSRPAGFMATAGLRW